MNNAHRFRSTLLVAVAALLAPGARAATLLGDAATDLEVTPVAEGLGDPTDIAILPDGTLIVAQRGGAVAIVKPDMTQVDEEIDVNSDHGEQGLLGVVADPNFAQNGYLYFFASIGNDNDNKHKVVRYVLADDALTEPTNIVDMGVPGPANHNGGGLIIDDGFLYFSVGDTGENDTPPVNKLGTCLNSPNGKILRVNLDGSTPETNPLFDVPMVTSCDSSNYTNNDPLALSAPDTRVYAWGFRNPFRFWVDPMTKKLWVGDVGEETREEIAVGDGGMHFGWPFFEGTVGYDQDWNVGCQGVTPATDCVPAAHDYEQGGGRSAVMGGRILDLCRWPDAWKSRYVFGDHGSGEVWTLEVNDARDALEPGATAVDFGDFSQPRAFRAGPDGYLYVVEGVGTVQRVGPQTPTAEVCAEPPVGTGGTGGGGGTDAGGDGSGATAGSATAGTNSGGSGNSGGAPGTSGASGSGTGTAGTNGATPPATSSEDPGCGCRVARAPGLPAGLALFSGALGLLWGRRRRR